MINQIFWEKPPIAMLVYVLVRDTGGKKGKLRDEWSQKRTLTEG